MDAKLTFQEGEDAVHRSSLRTAPDEQVFSNGLIGEAFVVGCRFHCACQEGQPCVVANDDAWRARVQVVCDGQEAAAHLLDVLLQFLCRRLFRGGSACRDDNFVVALAVAEQPVRGVCLYCEKQHDEG